MSKRPIIGPGTGSAEKLAQPWSSQTRSSCSVAARARVLLTNDWADHYSSAAMHLRLNGLLPPTAQPKK